MKNHRLPLVVMALVAAAGAARAFALPPSSDARPLTVEVVDDATLASMTGRFYGADMLTGVRIDLVSNLATAQGGRATAAGSLYVRRTATGFEVHIDSRAGASAGEGGAAPTGHVATGGERLGVHGIGQVAQIAGDGNRMGNIAVIRIGADPAAPSDFNGRSSAQAGAGDLTAQISFVGGGVRLGLGATGATIRQEVVPGDAGRVMQLGQIAGNGFTANNSMHLQMMTTAMPTLSMQQLGIQQALAAISGLRR